VLGGEPHECTVGAFVPHTYYLLMEQMQEVRIPEDVPPPTRDELRQICDEHESAEAIVEALAGLEP
jgi:hypothetical protein